jgi:hypothetical protein
MSLYQLHGGCLVSWYDSMSTGVYLAFCALKSFKFFSKPHPRVHFCHPYTTSSIKYCKQQSVQAALVIRGLYICEFTYSHW